jgi:hypothetical protein
MTGGRLGVAAYGGGGLCASARTIHGNGNVHVSTRADHDWMWVNDVSSPIRGRPGSRPAAADWAPAYAAPPVTTTNTQKNLVETVVDVVPSCEGGPPYTVTTTSNLVAATHERPLQRPARRHGQRVLPLPRLVRQRHVSAGVPLDESEHLFDTEWVARCSMWSSRRTSRSGR